MNDDEKKSYEKKSYEHGRGSIVIYGLALKDGMRYRNAEAEKRREI